MKQEGSRSNSAISNRPSKRSNGTHNNSRRCKRSSSRRTRISRSRRTKGRNESPVLFAFVKTGFSRLLRPSRFCGKPGLFVPARHFSELPLDLRLADLRGYRYRTARSLRNEPWRTPCVTAEPANFNSRKLFPSGTRVLSFTEKLNRSAPCWSAILFRMPKLRDASD